MSEINENEEKRWKQMQEIFEDCREKLDKKNDLREQIVKKSRDVTIESKRIIFHLHRSTTVDDEKKAKILEEAQQRLKNVYSLITCGIGGLLICESPWQYEQAYSPGMQEFIEAASFYYYLFCKKILTKEEMNNGKFLFGSDVETEAPDDGRPRRKMSDLLTDEDYLLGIADLTGELMRKCVSSGSIEEPFELREVLKVISEAFYILGDDYDRKLMRKYNTLRASLRKVDRVCYMIRVRGLEKERLLASKGITSVTDLFKTLDADMDAQDDFD